MDDSGSVALDDGFDYLSEKRFGHRFGQGAAFRNEIEQVLARLHALHDQHKSVARVASVQQLHHARHVRHLSQQIEFERHSQTVVL